MKKGYKILLLAMSLILLAITLFLVIKKKSKNKSLFKPELLENSEDFVDGYIETYDPDSLSLINVPKTPRDEYDVIIFYTGIDDTMGYKAREEVPDFIKNNYKIYYKPHFDDTGENVLDHIDFTLSTDSEPRTVTVIGFSAGGKAVMRLMNDVKGRDTLRGKPIINYYLIDPSIEKSFYQDLNYSKVVMTYGSSGMEGLYGSEYDVLDNKIPNDGGSIERVDNLGHYDFISYTFMNEWKSE
jgi:hypothetical protein